MISITKQTSRDFKSALEILSVRHSEATGTAPYEVKEELPSDAEVALLEDLMNRLKAALAATADLPGGVGKTV